MSKKLLPILFLSLYTGIFTYVHAQDPMEQFSKANKYFEQEHYDKAIELYEELIETGNINADIYYNLGNSYYRIQKIGKAILNYERALLLRPRDIDTRFNLKFTREIANEPDPDFFTAMFFAINNLSSLNELAVLFLVVFVLTLILFAIYNIKKSQKILIGGISLALASFIFGSWLFIKISYETKMNWAIIVQGPAEIRNGPGTDNSVGFTIPEGRKIVVLSEKDNWLAVGLKNEGLKGWIEKEYVEKI